MMMMMMMLQLQCLWLQRDFAPICSFRFFWLSRRYIPFCPSKNRPSDLHHAILIGSKFTTDAFRLASLTISIPFQVRTSGDMHLEDILMYPIWKNYVWLTNMLGHTKVLGLYQYIFLCVLPELFRISCVVQRDKEGEVLMYIMSGILYIHHIWPNTRRALELPSSWKTSEPTTVKHQ